MFSFKLIINFPASTDAALPGIKPAEAVKEREQKNPSKVSARLLHQVLKPASVLLFKLKSAIRQDVRQVHRYNAAKMSETFIEIIIRLEKAFSRLNSSSCQTFLICS